VSQVLTLFTTPVIYLMFDDLSRRTRARFSVDEADAPETPAPAPGGETPRSETP
jgi:hypothetical protein